MKKLSLLAAVCLVFSVLFGTARAEEKVFKVGFNPDLAPFAFRKGNDYGGMDLDMAREVAKRNGWKLELIPIKWGEKQQDIDSGKIDCIWSSFTINGREELFTWSEPYWENKQVAVVKKDSPIKTLADLAGKKAVAMAASSVLAALDKGGQNEKVGASLNGKVLEVINFSKAFKELDFGTVDVVFADIDAAVSRNAKGEYRILDEVVSSEQYGIGFKKGNTELRDAVQKTFKELVKDGTAEKICKEYFNGQNLITLKP